MFAVTRMKKKADIAKIFIVYTDDTRIDEGAVVSTEITYTCSLSFNAAKTPFYLKVFLKLFYVYIYLII